MQTEKGEYREIEREKKNLLKIAIIFDNWSFTNVKIVEVDNKIDDNSECRLCSKKIYFRKCMYILQILTIHLDLVAI